MSTPGRVVPAPTEELGLHGHLFISHSMWVSSSATFAEMAAWHDEEHAGYPSLDGPAGGPAPGELTGWRALDHPHTHSEPEPEEEWSWD